MKYMYKIIIALLLIPGYGCTQSPQPNNTNTGNPAAKINSKSENKTPSYEKQILDLEAKYATSNDGELGKFDNKAEELNKKYRARIKELVAKDAAAQAILKDQDKLKDERRQYLASKHPDFAKVYNAQQKKKAEIEAKKNSIAEAKQKRESDKAQREASKKAKEAERTRLKKEREAKKQAREAAKKAKKKKDN